MSVSTDSIVNALDSFVSWGFACSPSHSSYIRVQRALRSPTPSIALAFLAFVLRPRMRRARAGERKEKRPTSSPSPVASTHLMASPALPVEPWSHSSVT
jgi:hypothetical protein